MNLGSFRQLKLVSTFFGTFHGHFSNVLYDGVLELLRQLSSAQPRVALPELSGLKNANAKRRVF